MNKLLFSNPHNLLGKFAQLNTTKQYIILLLFSVLPSVPSIMEYQQLYQQQSQISRQIIQKEQELTHQRQILATLQKQTMQKTLTPALTRLMAQINQSIQQHLSQLHIEHSQWTFYQSPYLHLQLTGNFSNFSQFLTALLEQQPSLYLLQLTIDKRQEENALNPLLNIELKFKLNVSKDE